jgi:hypothetical protein
MNNVALENPAPWAGGDVSGHSSLLNHLDLEAVPRSLAVELQAMDVQVVTPSSIIRIKDEVCKAAEKKSHKLRLRKVIWRLREGYSHSSPSGRPDYWGAALLAAVVAMIITSGCYAMFSHLVFGAMGIPTLVSVAVASGASILIAAHFCFRFASFSEEKKERLREGERLLRQEHATVEWKTSGLRDYLVSGGEVPNVVLALATDVLEHCSNVEFQVEYTHSEPIQTSSEMLIEKQRREADTRRNRRHEARHADSNFSLALLNDPILWAVRHTASGEERHAIAVWDEKGMENLVLGKAVTPLPASN